MNYKLDVELSPELEAYRDRIEASIKPSIEIQLTDNNKPTWWQSKFGGLPYLPKGFEYPKSWNDEYLYLLAQINFAEVPHLEGFPDKGILQFYIAADEEFYGLDFENPTQQDNFRVLYFSNIELEEDNLITNFDFLPELSDEYLFPFKGFCALNYSLAFRPISINDYQFNIFSLDNIPDEIIENYEELFNNYCSKIGGYPAFLQDDPRALRPIKTQNYILLLQIKSDSNDKIDICWGDIGIGNFFIKESALKNLDFSEVLYNWDCS